MLEKLPNVDLEKLEKFELKAYHICKHDNQYYDCSELLCIKCMLCPIDVESGEPLSDAHVEHLHQIFRRSFLTADLPDRGCK